MSINLYSHQLNALKKIRNGCILCGGVGSGKSRTALAYYFLEQGGEFRNGIYEPMDDPPKDLYIITTARKRDTHEWDDEMVPFLLGPVSSIYDHTVTVDSWNNIKKYADVTDAFFIFDEQRVVGTGTWARSFVRIARRNRWILLSATPGDTWKDYAAVFVANGYYRNFTEFRREHIIYSNYGNFPKIEGYANQNRLVRYRRDILVDMAFDKPTVQNDIDVYVDYDRDVYRSIKRTKIHPETSAPLDTASKLCLALRWVVNSDHSRAVAVRDICQEKKKVIIFYNFNYELDILKEIDYGDDFTIAEWNGFRHDDMPTTDKWVYLVQYTAGAEGWNCTTTDTIIFYSQSYSYKALVQAKGRIDRLNTPFTDLYYYHLRSFASIDLAIVKALKNKHDFDARKFLGR